MPQERQGRGGCAVAGLYCVGDIVDGLLQISVGMGTARSLQAHNYLRSIQGENAEA